MRRSSWSSVRRKVVSWSANGASGSMLTRRWSTLSRRGETSAPRSVPRQACYVHSGDQGSGAQAHLPERLVQYPRKSSQQSRVQAIVCSTNT